MLSVGGLNQQLLDDSDLLIGMMWTRAGTPTGEHEGGMIEEVKRHVAANRPAMLYFSNMPVAPSILDQAQYAIVQEFKTWCRERGLIQDYASLAEFNDKLGPHLARTVLTFDSAPDLPPSEIAAPAEQRTVRRREFTIDERDMVAGWSAEAKELLLDARRYL